MAFLLFNRLHYFIRQLNSTLSAFLPDLRNYLDMLLPEGWDGMDIYRRREYFRDQDDPTRTEGTVMRQTVSNIEIWCECFGKGKEEMRPSDSYAISAIMVRIEGWVKSGVRQMLPIYGRQRVYTRTA